MWCTAKGLHFYRDLIENNKRRRIRAQWTSKNFYIVLLISFLTVFSDGVCGGNMDISFKFFTFSLNVFLMCIFMFLSSYFVLKGFSLH